MGAQYGLRIKIEGILHCPCRVMFRDIERGEIMKIVFDFRAIFDNEAQAGKPVFDTTTRQRDRMQTAFKGLPSSEANINPLRCQFLRHFPRFESIHFFLQGMLKTCFSIIDDFPQLRAFFCTRLGQCLHMRSKDTFL